MTRKRPRPARNGAQPPEATEQEAGSSAGTAETAAGGALAAVAPGTTARDMLAVQKADTSAAGAEPTSVEQVLALIDEERRRRQPRVRESLLRLARYGFAPVALVALVCYAAARSWAQVVLCVAGIAMVATLDRFVASHRLAEAARFLAGCSDKRVVGPLAEALEWPDGSLQVTAALALTELLPRLRAHDSVVLNDTQRACLYRKLKTVRRGTWADLQVAILQALEQVGDERAVAAVRHLAGTRPRSVDARRVVEAAQGCLPFLQSRSASRHDIDTLLRAIVYAGEPRELLLRPRDPALADPTTLPRPRPAPGASGDAVS